MSKVLILFLVVGLVFSVSTFWQGFHNSDLSYNILKLNNDGETFSDKGIDGKIRNTEDLWILGGKQELYGFLFSIVFMLCMGYAIGYERSEK